MRSRVLLAVLLAVSGACARETGRSADPDTTYSVRGVVRWVGEKIEPRRIDMGSPDYFKEAWKEGWPFDPRFEVTADGALPHTFVWVKSGPHKERKWDTPVTPVELVASRGMFTPHVFGIMTGQPLRLRVEGRETSYCFHARPAINKTELNVRIRPGEERTTSFSAKEAALPFVDDIYTWMTAYAFVLDHPFFAVTDAQGRFEIRGLPPGEYVIKAWHEAMTRDVKGHETEFTVTLASGATTDVAVDLR